MTSIPYKFDASFDFCWSVCALEHLGTLQNGLEFVRQATRTLRPGGVAVHTTEYNIEDGETIDNWPTVLYQKRHFAMLEVMLKEFRLQTSSISSSTPVTNSSTLYVDVPPYPHDATWNGAMQPPHIKLSIDGFPATSIAIIVEKLA